jgi:hypothetical protein
MSSSSAPTGHGVTQHDIRRLSIQLEPLACSAARCPRRRRAARCPLPLKRSQPRLRRCPTRAHVSRPHLCAAVSLTLTGHPARTSRMLALVAAVVDLAPPSPSIWLVAASSSAREEDLGTWEKAIADDLAQRRLQGRAGAGVVPSIRLADSRTTSLGSSSVVARARGSWSGASPWPTSGVAQPARTSSGGERTL